MKYFNNAEPSVAGHHYMIYPLARIDVENMESLIEQETLYVLQNQSLMRQIAASSATHAQRKGYMPTDTELHAILGV